MIKKFILIVTALMASFGFGQHATAGPYSLHLTRLKPDTFDLVVTAKDDAPVDGLSIKVIASMPSMASMPVPPVLVSKGTERGHYSVKVSFPMDGMYDLKFEISSGTGEPKKTTISVSAKPLMGDESIQHDHDSMQHEHVMKGTLGDWSMSREGSGTAWQPDSSPMYMQMLPKSGRYDVHLMGSIQAGYIDAGGKRGDEQGYANSMAMWMARRETGGGVLGLHFMISADPITNGKRGVPNLFQTGETLDGEPLVDRQHPHDMFAEASVSFNKPIGRGNSAFVYLAPIGEPALGNVMFMHRPSGMEIPEAPISHHWFDSTHISFGVATLGVTLQDKWKFESSAFNGHEPDEDRFDIDPIELNSYSGRVSFNPNPNWSFSGSYAFLDSPEELEPGVNQHRITGSATYNRPLNGSDNFAATLYFGRVIRRDTPDSDAFGLEATLTKGRDSIFGRFESVDKDELIGVPEGSYKVRKLVLGNVRNVATKDSFEYGIGGYVGLYDFPGVLKPFYGSRPVTWGIFLRIRPGRM